MATGAYDEVHHAHGYVHKRERHHWYWFVGVGATVAAALLAGVLYWQVRTIAQPVCAHGPEQIVASPDGTMEMDVTSVSCFGASSEKKVFIRPAGSRAGSGKAIASFNEDAVVKARWTSDTEVMISHKGGRMWSFQPLWRDVHVRYQ